MTNCKFCKEKLKTGDKIAGGIRDGGKLVEYHLQCYEFVVMNYGSKKDIETFEEFKPIFEEMEYVEEE